MKAEITWNNILAFLQGTIRERFYYNKYFNWLIRLHIFEQIAFRIYKMKPACYSNGECVVCGCATPALQMADKACAGSCYPVMMGETDWFIYKRVNGIDFTYRKEKKREFELRITKQTIIS